MQIQVLQTQHLAGLYIHSCTGNVPIGTLCRCPISLLRLMLYRRQALFRARLINYAFEFVGRERIA